MRLLRKEIHTELKPLYAHEDASSSITIEGPFSKSTRITILRKSVLSCNELILELSGLYDRYTIAICQIQAFPHLGSLFVDTK